MIKLLIFFLAVVFLLFVLYMFGLLAVEAVSTVRDKLFPKQEPVARHRAIEKPEEIIDWTDIQWNVEKQIKKEQ